MEPRAYFDPPSEREPTPEEWEKFLTEQDAITGVYNTTGDSTRLLGIPSIENILKSFFEAGIVVTAIVPPEQGWPIAMHCPICKETIFVLSLWAIKPKDGDYFRMNNTCGSDALGSTHNLILARDTITEKLMMRPLPMNGFGE